MWISDLKMGGTLGSIVENEDGEYRLMKELQVHILYASPMPGGVRPTISCSMKFCKIVKSPLMFSCTLKKLPVRAAATYCS